MKIWVNGKFNFNILSFTYFQLQESLSDMESCDPGQTLLQYLRLNLELKGTKSNCDGGCTGNCTVLLSKWNPEVEAYEH